jgi:hypothetical protein
MRRFEVLTPEALLERNGTGQEGRQTEKAQVIGLFKMPVGFMNMCTSGPAVRR